MGLSEIKELMQKGRFDQALQVLEELESDEQLDGLVLKSKILYWKGELREAVKVAEKALEESKTTGTPLQELKALINCGFGLAHLRVPIQLENIIQKIEDFVPSLEKESEELRKECLGSLAYLKGISHFFKGEGQQAIEAVEKSLMFRQSLDDPLDIVDSLFICARMHAWYSGKMDIASDYAQRSLTISEKIGNSIAKAYSILAFALISFHMGNTDEALPYYEKTLAIAQEHEHKYFSAWCFIDSAVIYKARENYGLAQNYFEKSLEIFDQFGSPAGAISAGLIGEIHQSRGNLDLAVDHFQRSLKLFEESGNEMRASWMLGMIGDIYSSRGELDLATGHYNKNLVIGEEKSNDLLIGWSLNRLAMVQILQGEFDQALNKLNRSLEIFTKLDNPRGIADCSRKLGQVYRLLGQQDRAVQFFEDSLNLIKKTIKVDKKEIVNWSSIILFNYILMAQDLDDVDKAEKYLNQLLEFQQDSKNAYVKLRGRFAEALVQKMSKQAFKKFQSKEQFRAIVDEPIINFHITILAMLNLCELLILELKIADTPDQLFEEISERSKQLYSIAQTQKSPYLSVMALILQTKLLMVKGDVEEASDLLNSAKEIAEEKNLGTLLLQIKKEQEIIQSELDKWQELFKRQASLQERLEQARVSNYLHEAKKIQETWVQPPVEMIEE